MMQLELQRVSDRLQHLLSFFVVPEDIVGTVILIHYKKRDLEDTRDVEMLDARRR